MDLSNFLASHPILYALGILVWLGGFAMLMAELSYRWMRWSYRRETGQEFNDTCAL